MPVHNTDIADVFDQIADYLEIGGENPFRIRAYRNAARSVRALAVELRDMVAEEKDLTQLPDIGKELAAKIHEIIETGSAQALQKLQKRFPSALAQMLKIPNLGPKRVRALYQDLKIQTMDQLESAARSGRIQVLPGFGIKTQERILEAIETQREKKKRFKLALVKPYADAIITYLKDVPGVKKVELAGSYRRSFDTVGDLDIVVTAQTDSQVMDRFVSYDEVKKVISKGSTRGSVLLRSGLQVDVRLVEQKSFGAALQYFTGSQAHNIALRRLGQRQGLKINEYGVFRGDRFVAGDTEKAVYRAVGLSYIPPELRENRGEIDAARENRLPSLIESRDLRGDLHIHTSASDGQNSIKEMALAAKQRNFKYLAVTDHSQHLKVARGLDSAALLKQIDEIDYLNSQLKNFTILKGIEVDILEDGQLDLPNTVLEKLDLVIGAVHSNFNLSPENQTARLLRAMDHPHFSILAHPTCRLIDKRKPLNIDIQRIIRKAGERGCFLELNAHPERLDLLDTYCQMAKGEGVLVVINSDAHGINGFDNLIYGVGQARRGWLGKKDILNTRSLSELRALLKKTM